MFTAARWLAISARRISLLADTPTCAEAGAEGVDITMWRALAAPADTPDEVISVLEEAARKATESDEFMKASKTVGFAGGMQIGLEGSDGRNRTELAVSLDLGLTALMLGMG